jgi:NADP-dependent 3-hydroxy acid dehydrogenase YdfG
MARLVFITGASSGIGQALALAYYEVGYNLALVARRTEEIKTWCSRHNISQDRYAIYSANVSDVNRIVATGKACIASQGLPDVVIANAGISVGVDTSIREDLDQLAQTYATNNIGLAATFHPFIDGMLQRKSGKLVGIGSVAGFHSN